MADDLKRVGLVFKADGTADFTKSLKTINALTRENYSAFSLAKSQWDKSTSSLTKLKDTQSYLTKQTETYSSRVYALKSQLEELENAENKDEKAIANKKQQLNNAESSLNKYKKQLYEVNAALESGQVKCMCRISCCKHYIVRDINKRIDRTHSYFPDSILHFIRRRFYSHA